MATNKFTMNDMRRNSAERCKHRVLWLLQITEECYCRGKFNYGLQYLQYYLNNDPKVHEISYTNNYWNWWNNQWALREEVFLEEAEAWEKIDVRLRRQAFRGLHNPLMLASEIHPHAALLDESYDQMMQTLIKTAV